MSGIKRFKGDVTRHIKKGIPPKPLKKAYEAIKDNIKTSLAIGRKNRALRQEREAHHKNYMELQPVKRYHSKASPFDEIVREKPQARASFPALMPELEWDDAELGYGQKRRLMRAHKKFRSL
jgi:hypothetical protein